MNGKPPELKELIQLDKEQKIYELKKQNQELSLRERWADLEGTQEELDADIAFHEKLKPSCVDARASYEDRVGRRKEKIESLQEALRILNGEDLNESAIPGASFS